MFQFLPKNPKFFDLFDRDTELLVQVAERFRRFLETSEDPLGSSKELKELEHEADRVTHEAMALLHRSFITPLERGDLRRLTLALDEIVDYVDDAARRIAIYDVGAVLPEVSQMGAVMVELAKSVQSAVHELRYLRKKNNQVLKYCIEIQRLENQGDRLHHVALASIFKKGLDPLLVIQWKEIVDLIESAMDAAEEVAHVIEGIVLENA
jgi:predicted phosphate transport protein (TIGR00153 family)